MSAVFDNIPTCVSSQGLIQFTLWFLIRYLLSYVIQDVNFVDEPSDDFPLFFIGF